LQPHQRVLRDASAADFGDVALLAGVDGVDVP